MVLTKSELIASLQNEVRILVHLAGKVEPQMRDYRPTPRQRSTFELLRYLTYMGPQLVTGAKRGGFDREAFMAAVDNLSHTVDANHPQLVSARQALAATSGIG